MRTLEAVRAFVRYALPTMWSLGPVPVGVVPIPMFEVATTLRTLVVPETFTLVVRTLEAVREFVRYALPTMWSLGPVPVGVVPIPMFDVATRVRTFVVPETFTLVVRTFEVVREFVRYALPVMVS